MNTICILKNLRLAAVTAFTRTAAPTQTLAVNSPTKPSLKPLQLIGSIRGSGILSMFNDAKKYQGKTT